MMQAHYTDTFEVDDDGWWNVKCACGWTDDPHSDAGDAADAYGDHREAVA